MTKTNEQLGELGPNNPKAWSLMQGAMRLINGDRVNEIEDLDGNFEHDHGIGKDQNGLYAFFKCNHNGSKYFVQVREYGKTN